MRKRIERVSRVQTLKLNILFRAGNIPAFRSPIGVRSNNGHANVRIYTLKTE